MWFSFEGVDYIANMGAMGNVFIEKAVFKRTQRPRTRPSISYAPTQTNRKRNQQGNRQGEPYTGDTIEDFEDFSV